MKRRYPKKMAGPTPAAICQLASTPCPMGSRPLGVRPTAVGWISSVLLATCRHGGSGNGTARSARAILTSLPSPLWISPRGAEDCSELSTVDGKDLAAVSLGRRGGLKGRKARAQSLSASRRRAMARRAAEVRWKKQFQWQPRRSVPMSTWRLN